MIYNKRGITLVSLVITIIIILILAGISIGVAIAPNGLIDRTLKAKDDSKDLSEKEEKSIDVVLNNMIASGSIDDLVEHTVTFRVKDKSGQDSNTGDNTDYDTFVVEKSGYYRIECWGADGGGCLCGGNVLTDYCGKGGYTSGYIYLEKGEKLYIYVGAHGEDGIRGNNTKRAFNGGGLGTWDNNDDEAAGAGGGASDVRLVAGNWDDFDSLKSRIMVAGGGGGSSWYTYGGHGGGLNGTTYRTANSPGTQSSGYGFGIGQDGQGTGDNNGVAGSGGGYYGGITSSSSDDQEAGAGGSSFISGLEGCNAISESSTDNNIVHTGSSVHYSGKYFIYPFTTSDIDMPKEGRDGCVNISYVGNNDKIIEEKLYTYTGNYETYNVTRDGYYSILCYGANGGGSLQNGRLNSSSGGEGGIAYGSIYLKKNTTLYVYVGEKGSDGTYRTDMPATYNGGGIGTWDNNDDEAAGAGGGASDVRLVAGNWDDFDSLKSRIIVAGGARWWSMEF